jgi:Dolichyl-phosphate-mannose-protein mannosyltransferase
MKALQLSKYNSYFNWFLLVYALFGFYTLQDYGVPLDELTQRHIGMENARYIAGHAGPEKVTAHGYFGPILEAPLYAAEQLIYESSLGDKIILRHSILFSLFLFSIIVFYRTAKRLTQVPNAAGLATVMYACYPMLFAHAHYNSKDTFFLICIVFALGAISRYTQKGQWQQLLVAGFFIGIASTVRMIGVLILASFCMAFLIAGHSSLKIRTMRILLLISISFLFYVLSYPFLWIRGISGFEELWHYITQNPWPWTTLAAGQDIIAGDLPWWYVPAWIGVTVPVLSIIGAIAGLVLLIKNKKWKLSFLEWIVVGTLVLPLMYCIIMRPTIYNGWRHVQFLFVPISLLTVIALNTLLKGKFANSLAWIIGAWTAIVFALWHPYGHSYFNEVYAVTGTPRSWDQDYWGLSARQGLLWVAEHDSRDSISISSFTESPELNALTLPEKHAKRLHFIREQGKGDYEVEVKRGRVFADLPGEVVFTVCPLKDTLVRVVRNK